MKSLMMLVACLLGATAAPLAAGPALPLEPILFQPGDGAATPAERGTVQVPLHHGVDDGRTLSLAFVRFASTAPHPGHPIVYLAGGPGGSGIEVARGPRFALFMALRAVADVIVLDQRGTGASSAPPTCRVPKPPLGDAPLTRAPYVEFMASAASHCVGWWREAGVDLSAYTTRENALDLETLRQALGAPKLNLLGISYGSTLALAALRTMPGHLDRVVLASPLSMDQTMRLPARTQTFLQRLDALAAADPRASRALPPLLDTMRRVLDRLDATPAEVAYTTPTGETASFKLGRFPVEMATVQMLKNPDTSRLLPMLYAAMAAGDFSPLAGPLLADLSRPLELDAMGFAVRGASCLTPARAERIEAEARDAVLGNALNTETLVARNAGLPRLDEGFCTPVSSEVPALVLTGTLDGRTYPEGHAEILERLSNAKQVVVENAGHDLLMANPEVASAIVRFLSGQSRQGGRIVLQAPEFMPAH